LQVLDLHDALPLHSAALIAQKLVLDIIRGSKYTRMMAEKDHARDQTLKGFIAAVKAMHHHFDVNVREASHRVSNVFNHYGNIANRPYDEETAAIEDILREFKKSDLLADLLLLGVMQWCEHLELDNEEFKDLSRQRYQEMAAIPKQRMSTARTETDKIYRSIVHRLEYQVTVGRITTELTDIITDMNVVIAHYRNLLAQRTGRANNETVISD
jgi:hypothetical protein